MKTSIILFLIALIIRLAAIVWWRFDGLYGQDAFVYLQQALAIAENLPRGEPPPLDFFWPNGFPVLVALLTLVAGPTALAGQVASLLCGAALAPLLYGLSKALFPATGQQAGLLAGLIIAVAGQPILSSVVVMADMPALFWATLSAWLLVRAWQQPRPAFWLLAVGLTLALAIITRWLYILLVPGWGAFSLFQMRRRGSYWWQPAPAIIGGAVVLGPQLWLSLAKPEGLLHSWLVGWRPANFFQRQFENLDGTFLYRLPTGIFYAQPAGHPAYIFPLLGLASSWGLWRLWRSRQWGPLILILGWLGPVYGFLAGIPYQNFRFGLTLYLPLLLLTGYGLSQIWERWGPRRRRLLQAGLLVCLAGMLVWAYPMLDSFLSAQNQTKTIARRVEQRLPDPATVVTFGLTQTLDHYTRLNTLELFYFDEAALDKLTREQQPIYLLVNPANLATQWAGRGPDRNFRWFQSHTVLTEIDRFPPYNLYQVGGNYE